jgi:L-ribulose-5-phosphate 3-epimerase
MIISFMSANYVARQLGFNFDIGGGWSVGDKATNDYYRPIATFGERFDELLRQVRSMGFNAIDLWTGHLNWDWATDDHLSIASDLLRQHDLTVNSLAGGFGATPDDLERACNVAVAVGTTVLGGSASVLASNRPVAVSLLQKYGVRLGLENHPGEKTPADLLRQIGDGGEGTIGAAIDTGWWGTQGYDAAQAIEELRDHLFHIHLKDVLAPGAHETCRFGLGVVPIERCVETLKQIGYTGPVAIEHEPEHYDPTDDCRAMLPMVEHMLGRA